ncbi:prepilin-type N-terminal cleavage/methylation domain-containing protein [Halomonas sp. 11-S5]|uniref:PilW family protein n=1 Tax=Halomonas sp. 11-S5 TaxID=2994064 RepID=UPI0024688BCE|nr:prepilin-type N-terminal cleavage/methylation domain-containing protein [Halomonas sp. 11-S5]
MKRNSGFSLVELMVALVIGLIIILGAGQLYLTMFQTNRQVETLSEKQAAVSFAVETLLRDIRRADDIDASDPSELRLLVPNHGDIATSSCSAGHDVAKVYKLSASALSEREGWALEVGQDCSDPPVYPSGDQPDIASAFVEDGFIVDDTLEVDGIYTITFQLLSAAGSDSDPDELVFHAVNRTAAVN